MEKLTDMPNIGSNLAEKLQLVDIRSAKELKNIGSQKAFIRIAAIDKNACLNMLYALEGAVQDIRWHNLSIVRKNELKQFFYQVTIKK
jgi:DNA transformation protein and related proteins